MTKNTLTYTDFIHAATIGGLDTAQAYQEQGADIHVGIAASSNQPKVLAWLLSYQQSLEKIYASRTISFHKI